MRGFSNRLLAARMLCQRTCSVTYGAFLPEGAGRFGAAWWSSEGAVRRGSSTARVSTTDSSLMVVGGFNPDGDCPGSYVSIVTS